MANSEGVLHPRPRVTRAQWIDLNGTWQFAYDDANTGIAQRLTVSEAAVRKHIGSIFSKLPLEDGDRRVQATLVYLRSLG